MVFMISSLTVRKDYSTEFTRCINQIIILLPLNKPCKVNLNGIILSVDNGLIINNSDLYQMIKLDDVVELKIPLPIFFEQEQFLSNCYFDFAQIRNIDQFRTLVLQILYNEAYLTNGQLHYVADIVDFLLKEAKVTLHTTYVPTLRTKNLLAQKLIRYVNLNIHEHLTTQDVSKKFFISQSYISIMFSRMLNINFKFYVSSLKVALSLYDLVQHSKSIHETATHFSFTNVSTYSKHFKNFVHMPPKKFIYHYRSMKGDHPVKIHTDVEYISKYLSQLKQNIKLKNNVISNINLDDLQFNNYFEPMVNVIQLNNLYELINFSESHFESLIAENFSKVNLHIHNVDIKYLNNLELQKLLNIIQQLASNDFKVTLTVATVDHFHSIHNAIIRPLAKTDKRQSILRYLTLIFNPANWEDEYFQSIMQLLTQRYRNMGIGIVIDNLLTEYQTIPEIINAITMYPATNYYINSDLKLFHELIHDKFIQPCSDLKQTFMQFISYLVPHSNKLIINNVTYSSLLKYYENSISESHILLARLLLDLNGKIAGIGFPLYAADDDQVMLIDQHQNTMPIVYIYSLLAPFIDQYILRLPNGIVCKVNSDFHMLLINKNNALTNTAPLVMSVTTPYTNEYFVFNRILNPEHGLITNMISAQLNHTFIDPQVLQQINQSNHPLATLTLHSNKLPLSISLETATIQYMMLSPNNDGKHHNLN